MIFLFFIISLLQICCNLDLHNARQNLNIECNHNGLQMDFWHVTNQRWWRATKLKILDQPWPKPGLHSNRHLLPKTFFKIRKKLNIKNLNLIDLISHSHKKFTCLLLKGVHVGGWNSNFWVWRSPKLLLKLEAPVASQVETGSR